MEKLPPIAKVYEACSALADDRILVKEHEALVDSSDYAKTYTVRFHDDEVSSNDNATVWQHYPGYPILALWMKKGILPVNMDILPAFADINWKKRNTEHKNRYEKVVDEFLVECEEQGYDPQEIRRCMQEILEAVAKLPYTVKGNRAPMIRK